MSEILDRLNADHRNMSRLLELLEREYALLAGNGAPDIALMRDAMHYLTHYSDRFHHPVEDRIFDRAQDEVPSMRELVGRLRREHYQLAEDGRALYQVLLEVESDVAVRRDVLRTLVDHYVRSQRAHMDLEEGKLFPLARRELDPNWWARLAEEVDAGRDPLFGHLLDQEYRYLRAALESPAGEV